MRIITLVILIATLWLTGASCVEHNLDPLSMPNYIKASFNGVETVYTVRVEDESYIATNFTYTQFSFKETKGGCRNWAFTISNIDLDRISYPYELKGPTFDFKGTGPAFFTSIYDPCVGFYGAQIDGTRDFDKEVTFVLHSLEKDVLTGSFYGVSFNDKPVSGEFKVSLARKPL